MKMEEVPCIMQDKIFAFPPYILIFLTFLEEALCLIDGKKERCEQSRVVSSNWIHATSPRKLFKELGLKSFISSCRKSIEWDFSLCLPEKIK